ncbi:hypothetical protein CBS101457_002580 [Exobasidium rhododendri]|nr:hypothetical protein CBS101457_002580 [Exobasidium rhododendri]
MVEFSPAFTPVHSLLGGLMLSVGVYHLTSQLGIVLGISGFFHESVNSLVTFNDSTIPVNPKDGLSIHHSISPEDDAQKQSEKTYTTVSHLFIFGLLAGGAILAAAKIPLESALGTRIFDVRIASSIHLGRGISNGIFSPRAASIYVPSALWGMSVGIGTKLGSGCTSGHFLCGLSRLSPRSIVATAIFFSVAVATHLLAHPATKAAMESPQLPEFWAIALLQIPALFYVVLIPIGVEVRAGQISSSISEDEKRGVHDQAAKMTAFTVGLHFAFGLALTGMSRPSKVLGFFDFVPSRFKLGLWDPSLAMVAIGGILPSAVAWFTIVKPRVDASRTNEISVQTRNQRRESIEENGPLYSFAAPKWMIPSRSDITWRLVVGAAFFGIGWGVTGLCPGPALTAFGASVLPSPQDDDAMIHLAGNGIFVGAMALGGLIASYV